MRLCDSKTNPHPTELRRDRWWASRQAGAAASVVFLLCIAASHPTAEIGVADDWSYIKTAWNLADTGRIVYNGYATAMLGWQLFIGAAMTHLLGENFTAVRLGTILIAALNAFVLHRTLVRAGISGQLAGFGTLALVLSPLYLMLSPTFMSDIYGCFAITTCLYCCVRALTAVSDRTRVQWILIAATANVVFGSARQIAWLGSIALIPATVFILRKRRVVLLIGSAIIIVCFLAIAGTLHWYSQQPYIVPEPFVPASINVMQTVKEIGLFLLDAPYLLLPIPICAVGILFLKRRSLVMVAIFPALLYTFVALLIHPHGHSLLLEPTLGDWVSPSGVYGSSELLAEPPQLLPLWLRSLFTLAAVAGAVALMLFPLLFKQSDDGNGESPEPNGLTLSCPYWLTIPFLGTYIVLLLPRASGMIYDRYLLGVASPLILLALIVLQRARVRTLQPFVWVSVLIMAILGISSVHNEFSLARARVKLTQEVADAGIPRSQLSDGWEDDDMFELSQAPALNDAQIKNPRGYFKAFSVRTAICAGRTYPVDNIRVPHMHALYAITFDPSPCFTEAPLPHVNYSRWLAAHAGELHVVHLPDPNSVAK